MSRGLKWIGRGLLAVLLIALALAWAAFFLLRNTLPSANGRLAAAGVTAPVSITRDKEGVPHIFARSLDDAHFALGFAHAQDRLFQMELQRRLIAGRLSEIFGDRTLRSDVFLRTLDLYGHAQRSLAALPEDARRQLEAYAAGVNAFMTRKTGWLEPRYPLEFLVLRHTPEPWTAADSVAIVKLMALNLSTNSNRETLRLALAAQGLKPAEIEDLLPHDPALSPPPLPDVTGLYPVRHPPQRHAAALAPFVLESMGEGASNNWVVSGAKTKSGKPLLANDPHLRLAAPAIWYFAHLSVTGADAQNLTAVGGTLPGVPLVVIGRNAHIAWGFTNAGPDVQDIFIEKVNPDNANEYLTPEGWRPFTRETITVKVKGGPDHVVERRRTRHGPVLPDFYHGIGSLLAPGHVAALAWTALADDDTTIAAGLLSDKVPRTVDDFVAQMRRYVVPMQAMVVADSTGNIALVAPGRVPIRDRANTVAGRMPVPGWDATYDWKGYLDFQQLPLLKNPKEGAIGTANARFVPPDFPAVLTHDWEAPRYRQQRIDDLVVERGGHDVASMRAAQADVLSPAVSRLQTLMIALAQAGEGVDQKLLDQLTAWDGQETADAAEPLVFNAWMRETVSGIYADDLGAAFDRYYSGRPEPLIRLLEGKSTSRDWCDDRTTAERETCTQVVAAALKRAIAGLEAQYGADRSQWRWGKAHVAINEHRPFGLMPSLAPYFNVEVETPGGEETLNRGKMEWGEARTFANRHAASMRVIYDFADLERSLFMSPTGQSGNPLSRHYRDFAERWARVDFIEIPTHPETVARIAAGTWTLTPAPAR